MQPEYLTWQAQGFHLWVKSLILSWDVSSTCSCWTIPRFEQRSSWHWRFANVFLTRGTPQCLSQFCISLFTAWKAEVFNPLKAVFCHGLACWCRSFLVSAWGLLPMKGELKFTFKIFLLLLFRLHCAEERELFHSSVHDGTRRLPVQEPNDGEEVFKTQFCYIHCFLSLPFIWVVTS